MIGYLSIFEVALLIFTGVILIGIPIGIFLFVRRLLRAYERHSVAPHELEELQSQVSELQERVADLTIEASDLRNAQRADRTLG